MTEEKKLFKSNVINASEIGQYNYCSYSWYLQKCGYKPESKLLAEGVKKHESLGFTINKTQSLRFQSIIIKSLGAIFFIFAVILIIFEVI